MNTSRGECGEESGRVMGDNISRKLKGNMLSSCVTPAYHKTTRETASLRE